MKFNYSSYTIWTENNDKEILLGFSRQIIQPSNKKYLFCIYFEKRRVKCNSFIDKVKDLIDRSFIFISKNEVRIGPFGAYPIIFRYNI
mgnify:CR=1 FL=1